MLYRPLGRTGLRVSVVGFGGSPLGKGVFQPVSESDAQSAVRTALDAGVNYFDTAPFYGETTAEAALGRALRGVPRDQYVLATKVGRYGQRDFDFSAARVIGSINESLERLGTDHVDLVQVHDMEFVPLDQIWEETIPALEQVRNAGKARFIGLTGLPLTTLQRVYARTKGRVDTVLSYTHATLADRSFLPFAAQLRAHGVGVINAAPLGMGLLSNRALPPWHPAPEALRVACARAAAHCVARGVDLADVAMQYAFGLAEVDLTLVGLGSAEEARRAVACVGRAPDPALLKEIEEILAPVRDLTWPSGLPENNDRRLR